MFFKRVNKVLGDLNETIDGRTRTLRSMLGADVEVKDKLSSEGFSDLIKSFPHFEEKEAKDMIARSVEDNGYCILIDDRENVLVVIEGNIDYKLGVYLKRSETPKEFKTDDFLVYNIQRNVFKGD